MHLIRTGASATRRHRVELKLRDTHTCTLNEALPAGLLQSAAKSSCHPARQSAMLMGLDEASRRAERSCTKSCAAQVCRVTAWACVRAPRPQPPAAVLACMHARGHRMH